MICQVCSCEIVVDKYAKIKHNKRYNTTFVECPACGSYIRTSYDKNLILNQYETDSYTRIASWDEISTNTALKFWKKLEAVVPTTLNAKGRLFELGTSLGYFLNLAKSKGFIVNGIECSQVAVNYAKEKFGIEIAKGLIEDFEGLVDNNFVEVKYDIVCAFEVIEHLEQPMKTLERCYRWLKSGGILIISTPNVDSPSADFSESETYHFGHLVLFGYMWLKYELEKLGFEVLNASESADIMDNWESMLIICKKKEVKL